jgi:hypothetical protein
MSTQETGQISEILHATLGAGAAGAPSEPPAVNAAPQSDEEVAAAQTLAELHEAVLISTPEEGDGFRLPKVEGAEAEQTPEEAAALRRNVLDLMMKRAAKQRKQGAIGLERAEVGVPVHHQHAVIKTPALGSTLLRWFSAVDICVSLLQRRGEMVLGNKAEALTNELARLIGEVLEDSVGELTRVKTLIEQNRAKEVDPEMFIIPKVDKPALEKTIIIRSKLGHNLYLALRNYDDALEAMTALVWNGVMKESVQAEQLRQYKKSFGSLYKFAARTNVNLFKKFTTRRAAPKGKAPASEQTQLPEAA